MGGGEERKGGEKKEKKKGMRKSGRGEEREGGKKEGKKKGMNLELKKKRQHLLLSHLSATVLTKLSYHPFPWHL